MALRLLFINALEEGEEEEKEEEVAEKEVEEEV